MSHLLTQFARSTAACVKGFRDKNGVSRVPTKSGVND